MRERAPQVCPAAALGVQVDAHPSEKPSFARSVLGPSNAPFSVPVCMLCRVVALGVQVVAHLGDFPRRLPQHGHAVYEYAPMPPVDYPELKDEMWCHRYYLNNLCDEVRFPNWPLTDHVELLQSLLAMWREEMARRPMDVSDEEAFAVLEIPTDLLPGHEGAFHFPCDPHT